MPIKTNELTHIYNPGTPFEHLALNGITVEIPKGKVTAIIGQTGSGKSTFVQHLNVLLLPTSGRVEVDDYHIEAGTKLKDVKNLRKKVGLVFQFPEYQLFEETIGKDIAFGPKNFGIAEDKALELAKQILPVVGLDASYMERSPFDLSGGQKRRVAIGGILVLDPDLLVLDEPTAGLDPQGANEMMALFMRLNKEKGKTVLLVSHDMEHVKNYCDHVIVFEQGKVKIESDVKEFFQHPEWMENIGINPPALIRLKKQLIEKGFTIPADVLEMEDLVQCVKEQVKSDE